MELNLRRPRREDLGSLVGLDLKHFKFRLKKDSSFRHPYVIGSYLEDRRKHFLDVMAGREPNYNLVIAESDNQIVGFISYYFSGKQTNIATLFIDEKFRRNGCGRELLDFLIENSRNLGINKVSAFPDGEAIDFYKKLGFVNHNSNMVLEI